MYWQRHKGRRGITVYYTTEDGNTKTVPRPYVAHLDLEPDHNIESWVTTNKDCWETTAITPLGVLLTDSRLEEWL